MLNIASKKIGSSAIVGNNTMQRKPSLVPSKGVLRTDPRPKQEQIASNVVKAMRESVHQQRTSVEFSGNKRRKFYFTSSLSGSHDVIQNETEENKFHRTNLSRPL